MKWSVYTENGKFTREVRSQHTVILKFTENYLKNIKVYKSFSYMKHQVNGKMLFGTKLFPVL